MIHQIQIKYDPLADRLLMQVRTRAGEVFAIWLTRRMVQRLLPPFRQIGVHLSLPNARPDSVLLPEARAMLADAVHSRPLPNADFTQRFSTEDARQPMGPEPLLAAEVELQADAQRGLRMQVREARGRQITLQFNDELHAALSRLFEQALATADWGLAPAAAGAGADKPAPPPLLN
ncbi:MAG: hypothetical protein MUF16_02210 [Burkholderiaceae bacterium]|jgi:hypothetical protein|nr:hypothetical protein [Burkholderiaceae bacterium]